MVRRSAILNEIVQEAQKQKKLGKPLNCIFALDQVLLDVSPRITQVLHSFAREPEMQKKFPNDVQVLETMKAIVSDYGMHRTLARFGEDHPHPEFTFELLKYWRKHFYSNEYLKYDLPFAGAVDFVNELNRAGADLFYLSDRDREGMLAETLTSLRRHQFPLMPSHANLILKPTAESSDVTLKEDLFRRLCDSGCPTWFFENDSLNINIALKTCPQVKVLFIETVHAPGADSVKGKGVAAASWTLTDLRP